ISNLDNMNVFNTYSYLDKQKRTVNLILKVSRLWFIWIKIIIFLLWNNPHIIHFQWLIDKKNDFYFMKFLKILGFTIVCTAHDLLPHDDNSQRYLNIFRNIYCTSDKIIVHSENNKREIVNVLKIDSNKVYVVPHGSFDVFYTDKNIT